MQFLKDGVQTVAVVPHYCYPSGGWGFSQGFYDKVDPAVPGF